MRLDFAMNDRKSTVEPGVLYIVATPIGNLGDITVRALDVLKTVDFIAAEDTRHTSGLLAHYGIIARLISCHEYNEAERALQLMDKIAAGASVALVSNAGTPTVSDPGYRVVAAAIDRHISVIPIPGVSAAITALCASGLPTDRFCFVGFVPKKKGKRDTLLRQLSDLDESLIFYESPRRLIDLLEAILSHMGNRYAVMARELTKLHEEFLRGPVSDLIDSLGQRDSIRGEAVLLVSGRGKEAEPEPDALDTEIKDLILKENVSTSKLAAMIAKRYNLSKSDMYQKILDIKTEMAKDADLDEKGA